jgi:hypothetical protein
MRARLLGTTVLATSVALLPALAGAAGLLDTLQTFNRILNGLVGLAVLLAILGLFYGLILYFFKKGDEAKHEGIQMMIYGVIAIFVMVSIWGIIRILQGTFGISGQESALTPSGIDSQKWFR